MTDGTDRGAPMTHKRLMQLRVIAQASWNRGLGESSAALRELVAEVDRLRALSTGEPSPESAALLPGVPPPEYVTKLAAELAAPDLESQAGRIVARVRAGQAARVLVTLDAHLGRMRDALEFYATGDSPDGDAARDALHPSGDTAEQEREDQAMLGND